MTDQDFSYEFDGVHSQDLAKKFTRKNILVEYIALHD
jgi:hypothetical protein